MKESTIALLEQKKKEYQSKGVSRVKLGLTDVDGVVRGKYTSSSQPIFCA